MKSLKLIFIILLPLIVGISVFNYYTYAPSTLIIEMKTSQTGMGQIFWNSGKGYSEGESYRFPLKGTDSIETYAIPLPAVRMKSIRIDPMEAAGTFEVKSLNIKNNKAEHFLSGDKLQKDLVPLQNIEKTNSDSDIFIGTATTNDPSLEIKNIPTDVFQNSIGYRFKQSALFIIGAVMLILLVSNLRMIKSIVVSNQHLFLTNLVSARLYIGLFFLTGILLGYFFLKHLEKDKVDLIVDAEINAGNKFEVYINEERSTPLVRPIKAASRHLYTFENIPGKINNLRIDPTDVANTEMTIYGVKFRQMGKTVLTVRPKEIPDWISYGLSMKSMDSENSVRLLSTNDDPILQRNLNIVFTSGSLGAVMAKLNTFGHMLDLLVLIAFWSILVLFCNRNYTPWKAAYLLSVLLGSYFLAWLICTLVIKTGGNIPAVYNTVGLASYRGLEKAAEIHAFWLGVFGIGIFAVSTSYVWRVLENRFNLNAADSSPIVVPKDRFFIPIFTLLLCYFLMTFPHLQHAYKESGQFLHSVQYDSQNVTTWQYFRHIGLIPFRDFWYTYGGFYYMKLPFPPDIIYAWLHSLVIFGVCAASIYKLIGFSRWRYIAVLLFVLWLNAIGFVSEATAASRYFLSLSEILLFSVCIDGKKRLLFLFWGAYSFYVFFMEVSQLVYAAPGCLLVLIAGLFLEKDKDARVKLLRYLGTSVTLAIVLIVVFLFYLSEKGALQEFLMFYRSMGDLANYSMFPANLIGWFYTPNNENLLLLLIIGLLVLSLWHLFSNKHAAREIKNFVPLAIAILTLMVFQKQIIRPHMALQLIALPIIGLTMMAAMTKFQGIRGGIAARSLLWMLAGFLLTMFVVANGAAAMVWQQYLKRPVSLTKDIELAVAKPLVWENVEKSYFAPSAFSIDGIPGEELREKLLSKMKFEKDDDLFVLGDDSYVYILLQKSAPFYITFYNQSILYSQQNTVAWLEEHKPKYVLWKDSFKEFDGVPNIVRVPLVFERVIHDYVFADTIGPFLILQRRKPEQPVALDFWRSHLGETVDLGFIPSRSDPGRFEVSKGIQEEQFTFLNAQIGNPIHGKEHEVIFDIQGQLYKIKFRERKDIKSYNILLNRVWFWQLARSYKIEPKLISSNDPQLTIQVKEINLSRDVLY